MSEDFEDWYICREVDSDMASIGSCSISNCYQEILTEICWQDPGSRLKWSSPLFVEISDIYAFARVER